MTSPLYTIPVTTITGQETTLQSYEGNVLLIVNTASKCGLTPQYEGLQQLYTTYHAQGFAVLGFPCNQFNHQEPGTEQEISTFCKTKYDVTFPLFAKIAVNGADTHPLYVYLKKEAPGLLGSQSIKWNFTKFLVDRQGTVVKRFAPTDAPTALGEDIVALLTENFASR
jgi:glutathione peroxidase